MSNINQLLDQKYGKRGSTQRTQFSIEAILMNYEAELQDISSDDVEAKLNKMKEVLSLIKAIREQSGMSQKELAQKTGMKPSYISRVENNKSDIQLSSFFKLLHSLGLDFKLSLH